MATKTKKPPPWLPTHGWNVSKGMKRYWAGLNKEQRRERLQSSLLRPDVIAKAEAARRPKLRGYLHQRKVSAAMERYWSNKEAAAYLAGNGSSITEKQWYELLRNS